jgi:autonomous glycyl radical cofactor GrcA
MERQVRVGLVAAHVDVAVAPAVVVDMAEQIALRILRHRDAEVGADAPEDQPDLLVAVVGGVQAAQHDEASAGADFFQVLLELFA